MDFSIKIILNLWGTSRKEGYKSYVEHREFLSWHYWCVKGFLTIQRIIEHLNSLRIIVTAVKTVRPSFASPPTTIMRFAQPSSSLIYVKNPRSEFFASLWKLMDPRWWHVNTLPSGLSYMKKAVLALMTKKWVGYRLSFHKNLYSMFEKMFAMIVVYPWRSWQKVSYTSHKVS